MEMTWSAESDPDDFDATWKKILRFKEDDVIVDLKPHDDGVIVVLASGREYVISFPTPSP